MKKIIKKIAFIFLFLLYLSVAILALYGAKCIFSHKCASVSTVISGAGSEGVVQVWEGGK